MRFGSVCSGIEAASVAWEVLGWKAAWFSEIEPFPSAVLAHHYPAVPNLGDMATLPDLISSGVVEAPDILCGGTPCQAFSIAGLRRSLDDRRGNLTLTFCEIANAIDDARAQRGEQPAIVFWENVPGVLTTKDNAFGCFLGALAGEDGALEPPGGKWTNAGCVFGPQRAIAWRILDAQYFGVAQRRRRVFVVASAREGFNPAEVLFEFDSLRRDTPPSREAWQEVTPGAALSVALRGREGGGSAELGDDVQNCLRASSGGGDKPHVLVMANGQGGAEVAFGRSPTLTCNHEAPILASQSNESFSSGNNLDVSPTLRVGSNGQGQPPAIAFSCKDYGADAGTISPTLRAMGHGDSHANAGGQVAVCFDTTQVTSASNYSNPRPGDPCHPLAAGAHPPAIAIQAGALRTNPASGPDGVGVQADHAYTLEARSEVQCVQFAQQVRRLTPRECERLQGFPDGYTAIPWNEYKRRQRRAAKAGVSYEAELRKRGKELRGKPASECPDGPRYKALGNSWAVPCVRWIGARILSVLPFDEVES